MKPRHLKMIGTLSAFAAAAALLLPTAAPALSTEVAADQDVEILTRGPVHEAFAESVSFEPEPGMIVRAAPPEPIEELPPEQELEGDNVTWIPGYWAWDDERNDFLWVSGIWRNLPPDRQWVPGYWDALEGGEYQWTSGYWADSGTTEVDYLPTPPPRSVDSGPNIAAPSDDHVWTPGIWVWNETRYLWRPGYWLPLRPNWTWVPSRYCWTRRGYVYVDGYWDYAVASRGVIFAPVFFNRHLYASPGYFYTPTIVVSLNVFSDHLFIRPRCGHYYFGDYYAPRYLESGFHASFSWHSGLHGYDPIYCYDRWQHRADHGWERRHRDNFEYFRGHEADRPSHTWAAMWERRQEGRQAAFATPLESFAKSPEGGQRFRTLDKVKRERIVSQRQEMRHFSLERRKAEARPVATAESPNKAVTRGSIARSPVVGRQSEDIAKESAPPKRPEARGNKPFFKRNGGDGVTEANGDTAKPGRSKVPATGPKTRDGQPGEMTPPQDETDKKAEPVPGSGKKTKPTPQERTRTEPQETTKPEPKTEPQRKVKPEPKTMPERKTAPPVREVPKRQPQITPKREPQVAPAPKPTKEKARPSTERQVQPQRQIQPRREIQPPREVQPQRQIQPRPEPRQIPRREVEPQAPQERQKKGFRKDE